MTITESFLGALEKQLMKTPAVYGFTEVLPRTFLATTGVQSWRQVEVFSKEPVRRMIIAMTTNQATQVQTGQIPFITDPSICLKSLYSVTVYLL